MATEIQRVFVAGAGLMGHGIAQVHAAIGLPVTLYEPDIARAEAGRDRIAGNLDRAVAKGRLTQADRDATLARVEPTADLSRVADADIVIEAVFEDLPVKTALWREVDAHRPGGRDLRLEHLVDRDPPPCRGGRPRAPAAVRRDAFLQPRAGHAAHRADPRARHGRRDRDCRPRPRRAARQAGHRLGRPARLHRQPDPDAVPRRGDAGIRAGPRHRRRHRYRRAGRAQPSDGPARARRLHRARCLPRRHARPRRRPRRRAFPAAEACSSSWSKRVTSARRPGRASTPTRANRPPPGRRHDRRPDRRGAAAPGDRPGVRAPASWPRPRSSATRPNATTASLFTKMGELGLTGGAAPRGGRRCRVLVPRLDAGHGGARRGRHVDGGLALGPHPVAVPGRDLGLGRAARAAGCRRCSPARRSGRSR